MGRDRFFTLNIEEVLPHIVVGNPRDSSGRLIRKNKIRKTFNDISVKMASLRLETFKVKGTVCIECHTPAKYFAIESINGQTPNLELYGEGDLLFTKDHILAKSKGGKDHISNMQTMCTTCNLKKGSM